MSGFWISPQNDGSLSVGTLFSDPLSGTQPGVTSGRGDQVMGRSRHGVSTAASGASTDRGAIGPINCPPPNPQVTGSISDC